MVDLHENVYSRRGLEGREHIPAMPFWVGIVRVIQLVLTFIVMILCAYSSSVFGGGYFAGYGLAFYVFVWTLIFLAYIFVTPLWAPKFYNVWIQLVLEVKTTVIWLSTFALLAEEASAWGSLQSIYNEDGVNGVNAVWPKGNSAINATKGAAAMGAFAWLSFVITLVVFGIALHKFRMEGKNTGFSGFGATHPAQYQPQYPVSYPAQYPANDIEAAEKARAQSSVTQQQVELTHMR